MDFKVNDEVFYEKAETRIIEIIDNKSCVILNPLWNWDEEGYCVENGTDYDIEYSFVVDFSELTKINSDSVSKD